MAHKALNRRKLSLLTSTALTGQAAALGALSVVFGASSAFALDPNALPQDPNVVGGAASFHQSGATLNVNQSTNRTVIDWRSFDIGSNATTNFIQPGASSIAVNRVNASANPTQIQGSLNANGQVWILNPNGVLFGKTAKIDVAGIVASTGNIDTAAFMRGDNRLQFTGADGGEVANAGLISVADGGLAAFVAPSVRNSGIIRARVGKVTLAAGTTFTLDLAGDQLVELGLGANNAIVDQSGQVLADGSVVNITAKAATKVVDSVINVSGTVLASSAYEDGGTIVLTADNITTGPDATLAADGGVNGDGGTIYGYANKLGKYDGAFSAQGGSQSGNGGFIETSGKKVQIADGIAINTLAANGATGNWSIDPDDLEVVGTGAGVLSSGVNDETSTISAATVVAGLASTNVTLQANNSITVSEAITSTATGAGVGNLALNDQNGGGLEINLNAAIALGAGKTLSGQGTTVNVGSAGLIQNGVDVAATGGATVNVADGTYNENVTINKSDLTLLSQNGRDATTIVGQGSTALGAVKISSGANNVTLGGIGHGFEIVGIDNASAGVESAAVYFQGANSGSTVQGNRITANGDHGLMSEYNAAVSGLTIDGNIFDGQTFAGPTAGGLGFSAQFSDPNVPRQLVVVSGGPSVTNTQNITFTNNQVTGTAGGLNASNQEQGNTLVTIDAVGATITGNTFAGTTTRYGDALRARGSNTTISGNSFDGANMGAGTNLVNLKDGALSGTFADVIANNTWTNGAWVDRVISGYNYVYRGIQNAVNGAVSGDTVNVAAGTYNNPNVQIHTDGITLAGASGAKIVVPNVVVAGGLNAFDVWANDVSIRGFEITGPAESQSYMTFAWGGTITRGIAIHNGSTNFVIADNNIHGLRNNILIDGRNTGSVTNNIIDNSKSGISVQYTDAGAGNSEGYVVDISGNSEGVYGNEWGLNTHLNGHIVAGGALVGNAVKIATDATLTVQQALLANSAANGGWTVQDQGYSNSNRTAVTVGASGSDTNQGSPLGTLATIQAGVNAVVTGGIVNVNAGSYALGSTLNINKGLTLAGAGEGVTNISTTSTGYGMNVTGDNVTLSDFTITGVSGSSGYTIKVQPDTGVASDRLLNFAISNVTIDGSKRTGLDLNGVTGATIDNVTSKNATWGNGVTLTDSANVTITNTTTSGNVWGGLALYQANNWYDQQTNNISVDTTNSFGEANPVYLEDQSAGTDFGSVNIAGYTLAGHNVDPADKYTWLNNSVTGLADWMQAKAELATGYITGWTGTGSNNTFSVGHATDGTAMSINAAVANSATGDTINVASGAYGEDVVVTGARNIAFDGSTVTSFTQNVASAIGGTVSAVSGFVLNAATTLLSNTVLNGDVTASSIDGSTAGGQTLTVNGGNNALGSLGATTRLGATSITGATTLNGDTYAANALSFAGPVTLTQGQTTFNTTISPSAAGNITFTGSIFGTTDGAQNVAFIAGPGTGAATANGDISLQNAGTDALWLGSMDVTGDDFSGATVYVGGSYNSTLTGNQTFTTDTLHTRGSVASNVGGNVTGPIVSGGDVNVASGGGFNGNVTAPTGTIQGTTITGAFTGNDFTFIASQNVDVDVSANSVDVTAPAGSVDGAFSTISNTGGSIVVNGQTRTGDNGANLNQIVVEGYTLPAGAIVTPSGEIILPSGMVIGLISPQAGLGAEGGKPKVIVVHSVQRLGELLAQGYVAIIVDLSKNSDETEEIALAN